MTYETTFETYRCKVIVVVHLCISILRIKINFANGASLQVTLMREVFGQSWAKFWILMVNFSFQTKLIILCRKFLSLNNYYLFLFFLFFLSERSTKRSFVKRNAREFSRMIAAIGENHHHVRKSDLVDENKWFVPQSAIRNEWRKTNSVNRSRA